MASETAAAEGHSKVSTSLLLEQMIGIVGTIV
jgi:hypothetical protein